MIIFLGRVVNPLGQAIDGKGDIDLSEAFEMPLDRKAPGVIYRQPVKRATTDRFESCRIR